MDMTIVHFTFSLILFSTVNSETCKPSENIINLSQNYILEGTEYNNITLSSTFRKDRGPILLSEELWKFQQMKNYSTIDIIKNIHAIAILNMNSVKTCRKMMGDIEEVRYLMMNLVKKENELFAELNSKKNVDVEVLNRIKVHRRLKQEYLTFFVQLQRLEVKIYDSDERNELHSQTVENLTDLVVKISHEEDLPKVRMNELNVEPPPKFDNDMQIDQLEKLQRLSLMIKDQLYEMEKPQNDEESEKPNSKNKFPEKTKLPRWLLTERDLKEIRFRFFAFKMMLEKSNHPSIVALKETFEKYGYTVKLFSKIFAEYYNITSIMLECESKNDTECEEMIHHILKEKRFEKLIEIFDDLDTRNIRPPF